MTDPRTNQGLTALTAIYAQGRAAHHVGLAFETCPPRFEDHDRADWQRGWLGGAAEWAAAYRQSWPDDLGL